LCPSFKLILAADTFSKPGGITPINEIKRLIKKISVLFKC